MARPVSRALPLVLAVVAALVLTGLGVYAAAMERTAARRNVVGAAEAASRRLARSLATLADEFVGGLPAPDTVLTPDTAPAAAPHLFPVRLLAADGAPLRALEDAYVADVLDAAERLGDDAAGREAQAAFLRAAADAAPRTASRDLLRVAVDASEGTLFGEDGGARVASLLDGGLPALTDRVLAAAERLAPPEDAARIADAAQPWRLLRETARDVAASGSPVVRLVVGADGPGMFVVAPVAASHDGANVRALLVGDVPAATIRARVVDEAQTLVGDAQVRRVALVGPEEVVVVEAVAGDGAADAATTTVLSTSLAPQFPGWRVDASAAQVTSLAGAGALTLAASVVAGLAVIASVLALQRAADEQARLAAERQSFLDHVAHEVRTPAGALLALSEELAKGHVAPARQPQYHAHLAAESRRLARLVEDTLDLSRLDAGKLVLERRDTDLRTVVAEGIEAAGATDRVVLRAPGAPVSVSVDAATVRRVVRNLVDNALRHGAAEPRPEVTVADAADAATVAVTDHGPGMSAEHLAWAFDRFWRAPSETHETKGVGVGLAICREIARAHGGDVTAESAPGRGATFTLRLPHGRKS